MAPFALGGSRSPILDLLSSIFYPLSSILFVVEILRFPHLPRVFFRKRSRASLAVHHDVTRLAFGQQRSVARSQNFVGESDRAAAQLDDPRAYDDLVVVSGRGAVLHPGLGDR